MARIISEIIEKHSPKLKCSHHEQIPSFQSRFATNVIGVVHVFYEMGNPFRKTSSDLLTIGTKILSWLMKLSRGSRKLKILEKFSTKAFIDECRSR